jgi:predicted protein tyrosine phosphatase
VGAGAEDVAVSAPLKILFVCGRNRRRSPTAERIFRRDPRLAVRSAGTSDSSARRVTEEDLVWADLVLVMERKYASRIRASFPDVEATIESLEIPDEFELMDVELVEMLRVGVEESVARWLGSRRG